MSKKERADSEILIEEIIDLVLDASESKVSDKEILNEIVRKLMIHELKKMRGSR